MIKIVRKYYFNQSSYRTYEEWKLILKKLLPLSEVSSYRTYEEWKQNTFIWSNNTIIVLTVPMRNGNIASVLPCAAVAKVLTVPMRNGNLFGAKVFYPESLFLPYL